MSSAKLLLSGFLVAGGLILGAFTLHGYFDPQWPQKHMHTAREPAQEPKSIKAFHSQTQFVATPSFPQGTDAPQQVVKASAKPDAQPADAAADPEAAKAAARKKRAEARKKLEERRLAEKAEQERVEKAKKPQQATFQWPWSW